MLMVGGDVGYGGCEVFVKIQKKNHDGGGGGGGGQGGCER